jgi:hypothetical protein
MMMQQAEVDAKKRDHAIRIARLAGIDNPEERVDADLTATIRFGDPALAELFHEQARAELIEEALQELEGPKLEMPKFEGRSEREPERRS